LSRTHLLLTGREQVIDLEHDPLSGETILHFRACENVIQSKKIDAEHLFTVLKSNFFEDTP